MQTESPLLSPPPQLLPSRPPTPPYVRTVVTQILLFGALFVAFNLGTNSQQFNQHRHRGRRPDANTGGERGSDFYFLSVAGGSRTPMQHSVLLTQMEKVARTYNAKFVVNIGELGLGDPLLQNAIRNFQKLRVPWYVTKASEASNVGCSLKKIKLPLGRTLDLIVLSPGLLQPELYKIAQHPMRRTMDYQIMCLRRILEAKGSSWRYVIGLHTLEGCQESKEPEEVERIHHMIHHLFVKYEVDAYLSGQGCWNMTDSHEIDQRGGVAYMSHPVPSYRSQMVASDGFLVHRVSFNDLETYFVTSNGEVVNRVVLRQRGAQVL